MARARVLRIRGDNDTTTRRHDPTTVLSTLPRPAPLNAGLTADEERRLLDKLRRIAQHHGRTLVWTFECWFDHYLGADPRAEVRLEDYVTQRERDHGTE